MDALTPTFALNSTKKTPSNSFQKAPQPTSNIKELYTIPFEPKKESLANQILCENCMTQRYYNKIGFYKLRSAIQEATTAQEIVKRYKKVCHKYELEKHELNFHVYLPPNQQSAWKCFVMESKLKFRCENASTVEGRFG